MDAILSIIVLLASVLLIFVVYIQNPKGGGLSSDFGSPGQLGGVKKTNEFIDKLTWSLGWDYCRSKYHHYDETTKSLKESLRKQTLRLLQKIHNKFSVSMSLSMTYN